MRFAVLFFMFVSTAASAQTLSLSDVRDARSWVLEDATCSEVSALFVDPSATLDITEKQSVSLLFFTTYLQALSEERDVPYGELLLEVGDFCEANPTSTWLAFR